jgi:hypothetical protein
MSAQRGLTADNQNFDRPSAEFILSEVEGLGINSGR